MFRAGDYMNINKYNGIEPQDGTAATGNAAEGPTTAGATTAGATTAGPATAGPTTAGPARPIYPGTLYSWWKGYSKYAWEIPNGNADIIIASPNPAYSLISRLDNNTGLT